MSDRLAGNEAPRSSRRTLSVARPEASNVTISEQQVARYMERQTYEIQHYMNELEKIGSFMAKSLSGIEGRSKFLLECLLEIWSLPPYPWTTLFADHQFDRTCHLLQGWDKPKILQHIAPLIVPSVEEYAVRGGKHVRALTESVGVAWNKSMARLCPQPDYAVGFAQTAFTADELVKIDTFLPDLNNTSYAMATPSMYFPFLTCEVRSGSESLDVGDLRNAYSMTVALRGIVKLFALAKREKELHGVILGFSFSHDNRTVRIYGHYANISDNKAEFYRHPVRSFDITDLDGQQKWLAYKFTINIYNIWAPEHLGKIRSALLSMRNATSNAPPPPEGSGPDHSDGTFVNQVSNDGLPRGPYPYPPAGSGASYSHIGPDGFPVWGKNP